MLFGLGFAVVVAVQEFDPDDWAPALVWTLLPAAFVGLGIWPFLRTVEPANVIGAGVAALSAPVCYAMLNHSYPNDSGEASIGRGFMCMLMLIVLPISMLIGGKVGQRVGRWRAGTGDVAYVAYGPGKTRLLADAIGLGAVATAAVILLQAHLEGAANPLDPNWEFIYHGILPAVPIAAAGACMVALPTRLLVMGGALLGTVTALLCSSLVVDPEPRYHDKVPLVLLAYMTLPITMGLGVLLADDFDQRPRARGRPLDPWGEVSDGR